MDKPPPYESSQPGQPTQPAAVYAPATATVAFVTPVPVPALGPYPTQVTCNTCHATVVTRTTSNPGAVAWLVGFGLCLVGLWPCSCIPCCISDLNDVTHYCPNCNVFLGKFRGGGC